MRFITKVPDQPAACAVCRPAAAAAASGCRYSPRPRSQLFPLHPHTPFPHTRTAAATSAQVWHPNISSANGAICLDILKDQWSPALTLKTALLSLQALLSSPQPDDPQDAVVAGQYLSSLAQYRATAAQWTEAYAHAAQVVGLEAKAQRAVEMGFGRDAALAALRRADGDEQQALELLLAGGG